MSALLDYDVLGWQTEDASLAIFQASEKARGVPLHDIASRLQRLLREASEIDLVARQASAFRPGSSQANRP